MQRAKETAKPRDDDKLENVEIDDIDLIDDNIDNVNEMDDASVDDLLESVTDENNADSDNVENDLVVEDQDFYDAALIDDESANEPTSELENESTQVQIPTIPVNDEPPSIVVSENPLSNDAEDEVLDNEQVLDEEHEENENDELVTNEEQDNEIRKEPEMNQTITELEKNIVEEHGGPVAPVDRNGVTIKVGDHLWCGGWDKELCTVVGVGDKCFFAEVSDDDVDDTTSMTRVYKHNVTEDNQVNFVHPAVDTVENLVECIDTKYGTQLVPVDEMIERFKNIIAKARNEENTDE